MKTGMSPTMAVALAALALAAGAAKQPLRFGQTAELDSIKQRLMHVERYMESAELKSGQRKYF